MIDGEDDEHTRDVGPPVIGEPARTAPLEMLAPGTAIGRYRVLRQLGVGGMGRVYLARDPELDRNVALKVVEVQGARDRQAAHGRLLREAQALAQLSHPAVVTVYDAATYGEGADAVYLAMEYVEGEDLQKWAAVQPRTWQELLGKLLPAGRGLEAAHRSGIVHRDFKPSNVMIGTDGRVRVLDFGLARGTLSRWSNESGPDGGQSGGSLGVDLTQTGNVMGTPAYMAPEQFLGEVQDERTDQFSFCVALYRLLYKSAPFAGSNINSLRRSVVRGVPPTRPTDANAPRRLWQPILRGLSRHPADRYASMTLLLAALESATSRSRWYVAGALGFGGLVLGAGSLTQGRVEQSCAGGSVRAQASWGAGRADEVRSAFAGTKRGYAEAAADRAISGLDRYFARYAELHSDVCERGRADEIDSRALDAQFACLDRSFAEASALVEVFAGGDDDVVARAPKSVLGLPDLDRCLAQVGDAPASGPGLEDVERALARGRALSLGGRYAMAMEEIDPYVGSGAAPREFGPELHGRLLVLRGEIFEQLGSYDDAVNAYSEARQAGATAGSDDIEFMALAGLCSVESTRANHKRALEHARQAEAILTRLGRPITAVARLSLLEGSAYMRLGDADQAAKQLRTVLETTAAHEDMIHMRIAALHNLATLHGGQGKFAEALAVLSEGLALTLEHLGPEHPTVGTYYGSRGVTFTKLGRFDEARKDLERALRIQVAAFGREHAQVARTLQNLGVNQSGSGDVEAALESYSEALEIKRKTLGPQHPSVALAANNVGDALLLLGRHAEAIERLEEAVRLWEQSDASASTSMFYPMAGLAEAHFASGDLVSALDYVERTLKLVDGPVFDPYQVGHFLFIAARVYLAADEDVARVRAMAIRARETLTTGERPAQDALAEVDALLAELPHGRVDALPAHSTPNEDVRD